MSPLNQVDNLINCLTSDEDLRQDLWEHYLSGNPVESLSHYLSKLKIEYSEDLELRRNIWALINNPVNDEFSSLLDNFTELEKSFICLTMLGLSVPQIAEIKGISEVRIRQLVATIRYNKCWDKYGTQEKINRRRKIWTK